jgi:hypothetical protein
MNVATKTLMTNAEIIEVNQDSLGSQARNVSSNTNMVVFSKKMRDGGYAVLYVNKSSAPLDISCTWDIIGKADPAGVGLAATKTMYGRNLFTHTDIGALTGSYAVSVPSRDCFMFRLSPSVSTVDAVERRFVDVGGLAVRQENGNIIFTPVTKSAMAISLINLQGVVVRSTESSGLPWVISRKDIRTGMYLVKIATEKRTTCQKVLIK